MIFAFIKICEKLEHTMLLQKGQLCFRKMKCFKENAEQLGKQRGDKHEGEIKKSNFFQSIYLPAHHQRTILESFIFCLYAVKNTHFSSWHEIDSSLCDFGNYILIISDVNVFIERVRKALSKKSIDYKMGLVQYYNDNENNDFFKDELLGFYKRDYYRQQNEYRIIAGINSKEDTEIIDIGDISDISIISVFEKCY